MRIALAGLHTECASASPLPQQAEDFERTEGAALEAWFGMDFAAEGIETVPLTHFRSIPGGPVPRALFEAQCAEILDGIRAAMPLDGVLLAMHGAYFVPGLEDPEGAFLSRLRALVGPEPLIAASYDLHGQITPQIVTALDIFAAYRTAPHIDVPGTRRRAAQMLLRGMRGGPRPQVIACPIPLLLSGEMTSTMVEPCKSLYAALPAYEENPAIWDANLMIGYIWADTPRARAASVVTCTDPLGGRAATAAIAQHYWTARTQMEFDPPADSIAAQLDKIPEARFTILADSGDNPTAGGVGDRADLLDAVLARPWPLRSLFAGIAAPEACATLATGARDIEIGGQMGGGGPKLQLTGVKAHQVDDDWLVQKDLVSIIVTRNRRPFHHLADFTKMGIEPRRYDFLVVKMGYLVPEIKALGGQQIMALSPGAVSQDIDLMSNDHRPRPIWPFRQDFDFNADVFYENQDLR